MNLNIYQKIEIIYIWVYNNNNIIIIGVFAGDIECVMLAALVYEIQERAKTIENLERWSLNLVTSITYWWVLLIDETYSTECIYELTILSVHKEAEVYVSDLWSLLKEHESRYS